MKTKMKILLLCVLFCLAVFAAGILTGKAFTKTSPSAFTDTKNETSLQNQTKTEYTDYSFIKAAPGIKPDMLSASYWTRSNKTDLLFTMKEISEFNLNNPLFVEYTTNTSGFKRKLFMQNLPEFIGKDIIVNLINPDQIKDFENNKESIYINGIVPAKNYWDFVKANLNLNNVPDSVIPRYAVCLQQQVGKIFPVDDFASTDPDEFFINDFISAEIMPFAGVVILHESVDGKWYYVLNGSYCCWVKKDTLAVCSNKEEWLAACSPYNFLIVTGNKLVLDETALPAQTSGMILPMGTKMRLTESPSENVGGRSSWGCYCVEIPCRKPGGNELDWEQVLIPVSEDVHVGYLPMTSGSVIEQAFKTLGHVYGYGGSLSSNDCSGTVNQIYACYGFELPRNARAIAELADLGKFNSTFMTTGKKKDLMKKMLPGVLLYMDGHLMIYLGTDAGKPYVISSCATCILPGHKLSDIYKAYCVFVCDMDMLRKNGNTWLKDISFILWKEF